VRTWLKNKYLSKGSGEGSGGDFAGKYIPFQGIRWGSGGDPVGIRWGLRWKIHTVPRDPVGIRWGSGRDPVGTSLENTYRSKGSGGDPVGIRWGSGGDFAGKYIPFQGIR